MWKKISIFQTLVSSGLHQTRFYLISTSQLNALELYDNDVLRFLFFNIRKQTGQYFLEYDNDKDITIYKRVLRFTGVSLLYSTYWMNVSTSHYWLFHC